MSSLLHIWKQDCCEAFEQEWKRLIFPISGDNWDSSLNHIVKIAVVDCSYFDNDEIVDALIESFQAFCSNLFDAKSRWNWFEEETHLAKPSR